MQATYLKTIEIIERTMLGGFFVCECFTPKALNLYEQSLSKAIRGAESAG